MPVPDHRRQVSETVEAGRAEVLSRVAARDADDACRVDQCRSAFLYPVLTLAIFSEQRLISTARNSWVHGAVRMGRINSTKARPGIDGPGAAPEHCTGHTGGFPGKRPGNHNCVSRSP